jgi:hypothetical protein
MTATTPKYPAVRVKLSEMDGNAFVILGRCSAAARKAGVPDAEIAAFTVEAMGGDYDHLLRTCLKYFDIR